MGQGASVGAPSAVEGFGQEGYSAAFINLDGDGDGEHYHHRPPPSPPPPRHTTHDLL